MSCRSDWMFFTVKVANQKKHYAKSNKGKNAQQGGKLPYVNKVDVHYAEGEESEATDPEDTVFDCQTETQ